jgi:hypothetical protein
MQSILAVNTIYQFLASAWLRRYIRRIGPSDDGHQFRATHVGTHRGTQDGEFDTQEITESGV